MAPWLLLGSRGGLGPGMAEGGSWPGAAAQEPFLGVLGGAEVMHLKVTSRTCAHSLLCGCWGQGLELEVEVASALPLEPNLCDRLPCGC